MSEQPLKSAINQLLKAYGLKDKMDEIDVIDAYEKVVSPYIAKNTSSIKYSDRTLTLSFSSSTIKEEINFKKAELANEINVQLKRSLIQSITIY